MSGSVSSWRPKKLLAWALSLALVGAYALLGEGESGPSPAGEAGTGAPRLARNDIEIVEVKPADPSPGSVVEVHYISTYERPSGKLGARLSVTDYATTRQFKADLQVLHASGDRLIVRLPRETLVGRAKLRVGYDKDNESKPYDMRLRPVNHRKLFREVVGGIALLVFGMRVMSRGSRQYTGHHSRRVLGRIGKRRPAAVGLGVVVGGLLQFTTTAAGLVVGLVESHLLALGPAAAVLLGAGLGAAVTPSVLGLASAREGLLIVSVGVLLLGLAADRRGEAFGKMVLGCGLMFFGLWLLRQGFEPLVSDPEIFPYLDRLDAATAGGRLTCVLAGVALTAVLQGPAPVFVLILGLAQSTGRIDLASALAILSGCGLGAALGTVVVAWPFGSKSRQLGRLHVALGLAGAVALAASVDLWAHLAEALVPGAAGQITYGKKVLLPRMGAHLAAGFALSQGVMTVLLAAAVPAAIRVLGRFASEGGPRAVPLAGASGVASLRQGLERVLGLHGKALGAVRELCLTGHRKKGSEGENILGEARTEIEGLFGGVVHARADDAELARLRQAALAMVALQGASEDLLRHAEKATEQKMGLEPAGEAWQLAARDAETLNTLHGHLVDGLDALAASLRTGSAPDLDDARAREIRLNAMESESRQALLSAADSRERPEGIALRLNSSELVNAYETVGNHLYRIHQTLASEIEQETSAQAS